MLLHALLILPLFLASYGMDGYVENCDDTCVSSCKPNWTEVDSHCYLWSKIQLSWAEAETACMKEGGHLASITSKAMNDKISNETKTNHRGHTSMWIGGTDSEKEGTWTWSDCSEWKFELWMQVSEGNQPKKYDCVEFFREGVFWGDDDCTRNNYFLCSQKLCPGSWPSWAAGVSSIFVVLLIILTFVVFFVYKRKQGHTS